MNEKPIIKYAIENNFTEVRNLVLKGADPNTPNEDNATALHYAIGANDLVTVKFLIAHGANLLIREETFTPLGLAVECNNIEMINLLKHAFIDKCFQAILNQDFEIFCIHVEELLYQLKIGMNDIQASTGLKLLHWVCLHAADPAQYIAYILSQNGIIDCLDNTNQTPLHYAAANNRLSAAKALLIHHANIYLLDNAGDSALDWARRENHQDIITLLQHTLKMKLQVHLDDSSDEEETTTSSRYNINQAWENCKKRLAQLYVNNIDQGIVKISFILHAMGIGILYSTAVNQRYYPLKETYLQANESIHAQIQQLMRTTLEETVVNVIEQLSSFILPNDQTTFTQQVIKRVNTGFEEVCKNIFERLCTQRSLLCLNDNELIIELARVLAPYMIEIILQHAIIKPPVPVPETFPLNTLDNSNFATVALNEVFYILTQKNLIIKKLNRHYRPEKKAVPVNKAVDFSKTKYSNACTLVWNKIKHLRANASIENSFFGNGTNIVSPSPITHAYIKDLLFDDIKHQISPDAEIWSLSFKFPFLRPYISITSARLQALAQEYLVIAFPSILRKNRQFLRPSPIPFTFMSKDSITFFAHLRCSNRMQKRAIKNLQMSELTKVLSLSDQKQGKEYIRATQRSWLFGEHMTAIETQNILRSFGREDYVENAGSYEDLYQRMRKLIDHLNAKYKLTGDKCIRDHHIAKWIRLIFLNISLTEIDDGTFPMNDCDKDILKTFLSAACYLILGCEVARNPSALITNQMMLDLIMANHLSWEAAISQGEMPMAPTGAVGVARRLHEFYAPDMPYPYEYPGTLGGTKEDTLNLISREYNIALKWFVQVHKFNLVEDDPNRIAFIISCAFKKWFSGESVLKIKENYRRQYLKF